jgi:ATP-dependent Clp protease ATP-binding subunit ClpA
LANVGYDPKMGARPLGRKIDELIKIPLSKKILFEGISNCEILADYTNDAVVFTPVINNSCVDSHGIVMLNQDCES